MGTALKLSTVYHSQTYDQAEVVNCTMGDLLRCLVGERVTTWDEVLPVPEFAYNSLVNRPTGLSLFEVVMWHRPRKPINILPMFIYERPSALAKSFAQYLRELHEH